MILLCHHYYYYYFLITQVVEIPRVKNKKKLKPPNADVLGIVSGGGVAVAEYDVV